MPTNRLDTTYGQLVGRIERNSFSASPMVAAVGVPALRTSVAVCSGRRRVSPSAVIHSATRLEGTPPVVVVSTASTAERCTASSVSSSESRVSESIKLRSGNCCTCCCSQASSSASPTSR